MTGRRALAPYSTSVFTVFSRLAREADAVNLGQGFPDFDGPAWILDAADRAMREGRNQYAMSHGATRLREAIAVDQRARLDLAHDVEREITVTSGATEAIAAAILGLVEPGDEVLTLAPFYDSYRACTAMAGGVRFARSRCARPTFTFDRDELAAAFERKPKLFVFNTPHNPTGRVFTRDEIEFLVSCAQRAGTLDPQRRGLRASGVRRPPPHLASADRSRADDPRVERRQDVQPDRLEDRLGVRQPASRGRKRCGELISSSSFAPPRRCRTRSPRRFSKRRSAATSRSTCATTTLGASALLARPRRRPSLEAIAPRGHLLRHGALHGRRDAGRARTTPDHRARRRFDSPRVVLSRSHSTVTVFSGSRSASRSRNSKKPAAA